MSLGSWLWGQSQIDEAVDKATSEFIPSGTEDIALNLEICDQIRSKSVQPKVAMRSLKRRLNHKNPNVQLLALHLTDTCVKNGGDHFVTEIASREFQDNLVSILKIPGLNYDVKQLILRLIQNWGMAFEARPNASYVTQVYKTLQNEGFTFPPRDYAATSAAMVSTQTAPEWIDSDVCLRCRTPFSFTNRKHHCRNCGQVFDQQCSSKSMPLPHYGITVDVRVCDTCYNKLSKKSEPAKPHSPRSPYQRSTTHDHNRHRSARSLADEELQRAIELSLQEANMGPTSSSAPVPSHHRPGYSPSYAYQSRPAPPAVERTTRPKTVEEEEDEQLQAAIQASLREAEQQQERQNAVRAPMSPPSEPHYATGGQTMPPSAPSAEELSPRESDAILSFSQSVDGVPSPHAMGRISSLYTAANSVGPKLSSTIADTQRKEVMLSGMNDKLSEVVQLYEQKMTLQAQALAQAQDQLRLAQQHGYAPQAHWVPHQGVLQSVQASQPRQESQQPMTPIYLPQTQYPVAATPVPQAQALPNQPPPAPQDTRLAVPSQQSYQSPGQQVPSAPEGLAPSSSPQQYLYSQGALPRMAHQDAPQPASQQQPSYQQPAYPSQQQHYSPVQAPPAHATYVSSPPAGSSWSSNALPVCAEHTSTPYSIPNGFQSPPPQSSQPQAAPPQKLPEVVPSAPFQAPQTNGQNFSSGQYSRPQEYQTPSQMYQAPNTMAPPPSQPAAAFSSSSSPPVPPQQTLTRTHSVSERHPASASTPNSSLTRSATIATHDMANKYAPLQALQAHISSPPPQPQSLPQTQQFVPQPQNTMPGHPAPQLAPPAPPGAVQRPPEQYVQPGLFPTAPTSAPQAFQAIHNLAPPSTVPYGAGGIYGSEAARKSDVALIEL